MDVRRCRRAPRVRRHLHHARGGGAPLKRTLVATAATLALILIGTLEAEESARAIADLTNITFIRPNGAGLSTLAFLASALIYAALGWWIGDSRAALRTGALVGLVSGLVGGTLRAMLIADAVREAIARNAVVPEWFIAAVLIVFVVIETLVSIAGAAAIAFVAARFSRGARTRPPA